MLTSIKRQLEFLSKGFIIGFTDIIPGISGGTMALVLGIYDQVIRAAAAINSQWISYIISLKIKKSATILDYNLLLPLAIGIVSGVLFFTKVIPLIMYIEKYTFQVFSFFFGLILHTILSIIWNNFKWSFKDWFFVLAGLSLGLCLLLLGQQAFEDNFLTIFGSGFLSATAMILPGISGALILMLLGKYAIIFNAIANLNFLILFPFICGFVCSLVFITKLLAVALKKFQRAIFNFINGILISSLIVLWPFQYRSMEQKLNINFDSFYMPTNFADIIMALGLMGVSFFLLLKLNISITKKTNG
tara:strand:+ start:331 stop:1239 length:909 start_codon:yes stop_codon:yes gene_type:complete